MDDQLKAPPADDVDFLAACIDREGDGIELAYRALDRVAERRAVEDLSLLVRPDGLGPQLFVPRRLRAATATAAELVIGAAGFYHGSDPVDDPALAVLARVCELALTGDAARQRAAAAGGRLASRQVMELAVARAAACSARYGWAHTAVLLSPADPAGEPTWDDLGEAVAAAARVGDEVGSAGPGRAVALLGNAGADAVPRFLERVHAALGAGGVDHPRLEVTTVGMPRDTVDPEEVWRLLAERLAARVRPAPDPWSGSLPSDLELDLRALPGVLSVGTTGRGLVERPQLTVVASEPTDALHREVGRRLALRFGDEAVPLVTIGPPSVATWPSRRTSTTSGGGGDVGRAVAPPMAAAEAAPGSNGHSTASARDPVYAHRPGTDAHGRVALLGARYDVATGTSEVSLARAGVRAVGRAAGGPLPGGAQATLAALGMLGVQVPYFLRSADRVHDVPGAPVIVVLAPRQVLTGRGSAVVERMGVATGDEEVEAAGRATLGALNRFLGAAPAPVS